LQPWYLEALPDAVSYASSLLGSREQGEDVVQECFCRLLGHARTYDLQRDGRKLLFRAVSNACINRRTRRRRHVRLDEQGRYDDGRREQVADKASSPFESAVTKELYAAIIEGLQRLTVPYRSALQLSSLGYRPAEIAEILQWEPSRVRVILFRARKAMAAFLNARFAAPEEG
jgi:RNA polymerase sigma-70 factor (ECF subfamily)